MIYFNMMKYLFKILFILLIFLYHPILFSEINENLNFVNYNFLKTWRVRTLAQDKFGFLWIGTETGIIKFDGSKKIRNNISSFIGNKTVYSIYITKKNHMWISLKNKIIKIDNKTFYNYSNTKELKFKALVPIYEYNNTIWFINEKNFLFKYNGKSIKKFFINNNYKVNNVLIDNNKLYIGTKKNGLIIFENNKLKIINEENGLLGNSVNHIYSKKNGNIFLLTNKGINVLKNYKLKVFIKKIIQNNSFDYMYIDSLNRIWVKNFYDIYLIKNNKIIKKFNINDYSKPKPQSIRLNQIFEDRYNNIWFLSKNFRLHVYTKNKIKVVSILDGLPNNNVWTCYIDSEKNIWIGTEMGLSKYFKKKELLIVKKNNIFINNIWKIIPIQNKKSIIISSKYSISSNQKINEGLGISIFNNNNLEFPLNTIQNTNRKITSILKGKKNIWVCTTKGLFIFKNKTFFIPKYIKLLSNELVFEVVEQSNGNLWVRTKNALFIIKKKKILKFSEKNGIKNLNKSYKLYYFNISKSTWILGNNYCYRIKENFGKIKVLYINNDKNNRIKKIIEDKLGNIWFIYKNKIKIFEKDELKSIDYFNNKQLIINCLMIKGTDLWVGTNSGIIIHSNKKWEKINIEKINQKNIDNIIKDSYERIWIIYKKKGFDILYNGKLISKHIGENLLEDKIKEFFSDNTNTFLITNKGLYKYNYKMNFFKLISTNDIFKSGNICCMKKYSEDLYIIGASKGILLISNSKDYYEGHKPFLYFENLYVSGKKIVNKKKEIITDNENNSLKFIFNTVSLSDSQNILYKYKLLGYDSAWRYTKKKYIKYSNVKPGYYNFTLFVRNRNGKWNNKPILFDFNIKLNFFYSNSFNILIGIILVFFSILFYSIITRIKKKKKKNSLSIELQEQLYQKYIMILNIINKEKIFLDENFSLNKLSKITNISIKQLSEIININSGTNFNCFINKFRVEESKKLLLNKKNNKFTIEYIAFNSGFKSKSTFYSSFKKEMNMTPIEFRNKFQQ